MKRIAITITLDCPDDLPQHVIEWMALNLAEHAVHEFGDDYDPAFVEPNYDGPPLPDDGTIDVQAATVHALPEQESLEDVLRREQESLNAMARRLQRDAGPSPSRPQ